MVWSSKSEYGRLSFSLATAAGLDFQRRVLPLLRVIWSEAGEVPKLRSLDRMGADHLVWSDEPPFPVVIQCKGFEVQDHELGASQIEQCVSSIRTFRKGGACQRL